MTPIENLFETHNLPFSEKDKIEFQKGIDQIVTALSAYGVSGELLDTILPMAKEQIIRIIPGPIENKEGIVEELLKIIKQEILSSSSTSSSDKHDSYF